MIEAWRIFKKVKPSLSTFVEEDGILVLPLCIVQLPCHVVQQNDIHCPVYEIAQLSAECVAPSSLAFQCLN